MALTRTPVQRTSLHGRRVALGDNGELLANEKEVTKPCVDATITLAAPVSTTRAITIQLKDAEGNDINYQEMVELYVLLDANGNAFAVTGGSTGIAIGTDGALLAKVAKKAFVAISEADGDIDLTWTDTASEVAYLALRLPNGRFIVSGALTI